MSILTIRPQESPARLFAWTKLANEKRRCVRRYIGVLFMKVKISFSDPEDVYKRQVATRKARQMALNAYAPHLPELLGGSADLTSSNLTNWEGVQAMRPDTYLGRHINYGVREFGMCAILNGIALYGGFIPYGATFLTFADYGRNALRMAALMKLRSIFVFTHDSIGVGEDGPTHQPLEQTESLRIIPNMDVWRPADP